MCLCGRQICCTSNACSTLAYLGHTQQTVASCISIFSLPGPRSRHLPPRMQRQTCDVNPNPNTSPLSNPTFFWLPLVLQCQCERHTWCGAPGLHHQQCHCADRSCQTQKHLRLQASQQQLYSIDQKQHMGRRVSTDAAGCDFPYACC